MRQTHGEDDMENPIKYNGTIDGKEVVWIINTYFDEFGDKFLEFWTESGCDIYKRVKEFKNEKET
jgi:hypothetical protein